MRDELFIRGDVPMTKSEVRAVALSKLELKRDSVIYDIGAGTGSVSVEAALFADRGMVYAVEQKKEAVDLIIKNKEKFGIKNIETVYGRAPEALDSLETATHAFIGGTSGEMSEIIKILLDKNPKIRIVITVIALESLNLAVSCLKGLSIDGEIVTVQTARARLVAGYHMMQGQNPVFIISFGGEEL